MKRQKRQASSTAHLINAELSGDGFIQSSPIANKRANCKNKKSHNVGDGWLWRPSRPKIPSPNASPVPLRWERNSSSKPKFVVPPPEIENSEIKSQPTGQKAMGNELTSSDSPLSLGSSQSYSSEYSSDAEADDIKSQPTLNVGHTPGPKFDFKTAKESREVAERLQAIHDKMTDKANETIRNELVSLRESVRLLEERIQRNEVRAAIRHDILFDALKKISEDVNKIRSNSTTMMSMSSMSGSEENGSSVSGENSEIGSASPPPNKKRFRVTKSPGPQKAVPAQPTAARKTMERCLSQYMDEMNSASTAEEVKKRGELCKKYAENLIKTYM